MMKLFKILLLFLFVIVSHSILSSQDVDWNTLIESWRKEYHVPGMSVGIIKDGKIILSEGYGVIEEGKSTHVDENTLFAIASNTKAFISASLARLVGEGKLK